MALTYGNNLHLANLITLGPLTNKRIIQKLRISLSLIFRIHARVIMIITAAFKNCSQLLCIKHILLVFFLYWAARPDRVRLSFNLGKSYIRRTYFTLFKPTKFWPNTCLSCVCCNNYIGTRGLPVCSSLARVYQWHTCEVFR